MMKLWRSWQKFIKSGTLLNPELLYRKVKESDWRPSPTNNPRTTRLVLPSATIKASTCTCTCR